MFPILWSPRANLRLAVVALAVAASLVTAACSNSSTTSSGGTDTGSTTVSADTKSLVTSRLAQPTAYRSDAPPITDVAKAKGKTVLYIPISLQLPAFQSVLVSMQE